MMQLISLLWKDNLLPLCFGGVLVCLLGFFLQSFKGFPVEVEIPVELIEA